MSKRKKIKKQWKKASWHESLNQETKHSLWGLASLALAIVLVLAHFEKAGVVGQTLDDILVLVFGKGFFLVPAALLLASVSFFAAHTKHLIASTFIGSSLFLLSALGLVDVIAGSKIAGYAGFIVSFPVLRFFDFWASAVILFALLAASFLIMLNISLKPRSGFFGGMRGVQNEENIPQKIFQEPSKEVISPPILSQEKLLPTETEEASNVAEAKRDPEHVAQKKHVMPSWFRASSLRNETHSVAGILPYHPPPLDFLENTKGVPSSGDIKAQANIIRRTLANFGIDVEMGEVNIGPSVTQYTLKPAEGIKLSRITALQNDLALALAAHPLRIEAPIPGKSLVGIEVPNRSIALVGLRSILELEDYQKSTPLTFALGRDVTGRAIFADLAKMPHLLVAGSTGSGKSITIHIFLLSLLYKNSPQFLRFLMIDPKRVELSVYNRIPHMLAPAITDARKAIFSLRWAAKEMERRYELVSEAGARDIASYNSVMAKEKKFSEIMPNIVVVIDELADLMSAYPREIEASIVRLAQMSRAVGIHLVVSTQRPSVEVITGLIKANITARVALQVASGIDSRTILDMSGAEKLLGNGDMLYIAGDTSKPKRIQGAFVSESEIKHVVNHIVAQMDTFLAAPMTFGIPNEISNVTSDVTSFDDNDENDDELYEQAREIVVEAGKASASYLQRRLRVGYARAARLLDILEERGIIGPGEGAKPRDVLIKRELLPGEVSSERETKENDLENLDKISSTRQKSSQDIPYTNFD